MRRTQEVVLVKKVGRAPRVGLSIPRKILKTIHMPINNITAILVIL